MSTIALLFRRCNWPWLTCNKCSCNIPGRLGVGSLVTQCLCQVAGPLQLPPTKPGAALGICTLPQQRHGRP